jgi:hypothetical protein
MLHLYLTKLFITRLCSHNKSLKMQFLRDFRFKMM